MTVGKLFEFASKREQPGPSSSIRLETVYIEHNSYKFHGGDFHHFGNCRSHSKMRAIR